VKHPPISVPPLGDSGRDGLRQEGDVIGPADDDGCVGDGIGRNVRGSVAEAAADDARRPLREILPAADDRGQRTDARVLVAAD
jgi:hypothetical protein